MTARGATTIVIGPRTRAGRAIAELAATRGDDVVLVARHGADAAALAGHDATVLRVDHDVDLLGAGNGPVRIAVCALGPVHPDAVQTDVDAEAFLRDLGFIERVLGATSGRPVSVVLISSIIALAPGADRRYYGGWKCLVEQQLGQTVRGLAPEATFSVVYPGRIVEGAAGGRLPQLHTTYPRLAQTLDMLADGPSRARVSGIDARLWMVVNSLKILMHSVLPLGAPMTGRPIEQAIPANERHSRP